MGAENPITGFFNWDILGSYAGATAATLIILRILEQMDEHWGFLTMVPTIVEAYIIGTTLLVLADVFLPPPPTAASLILCVVNGFGVSIAAVGGNTVLGLPHKPGPIEKRLEGKEDD